MKLAKRRKQKKSMSGETRGALSLGVMAFSEIDKNIEAARRLEIAIPENGTYRDGYIEGLQHAKQIIEAKAREIKTAEEGE